MEASFSVFRKIENSPSVAVHGRVFTKPHIVELMLDLANYQGEQSVKVLDPGCGQGAFMLAAAARLVRANGPLMRFEDFADCLTGVEKDSDSAEICRKELRNLLLSAGVSRKLATELAQHWVIEADFLDHNFLGRYDLVTGNPPYVRQEAIPKRKLEKYRATLDCFYDRADLYVAFFERGLKLLSPAGKLAFICPNRFTKNNYGRKLRALIADNFSVEHVLDLAQASPFEAPVASYPGIFVIKQAPQARHVNFFRLTDATPEECDSVRRRATNDVVAYHRFDGWFTGEQKWSTESPQHLKLLRRLEAENVSLGSESSGCRVGIGVATGADEVFIVDQHSGEVEDELLMPLVTTKDIASGTVRWRGTCVINPFLGTTANLVDLKKYPKARAYFERFRARIEGRNVARRDPRRWYRTIDRIYPDLRTVPKLLIPDIKAENLIVLEPGNLYPHHNLYYVATESWDLRALRTILRSSVGKFFVWMYGVRMRGDFLRFQAQYLRRICIPRLLFVPRRAMDSLIAADTSNDQLTIDSTVASLYDLSAEEMQLVLSAAATRRPS